MRIRTLAGIAIAGASAAAIAGGVAYASTGDGERGAEPTVRIVQDSQPGEQRDCPGEAGTPTTETGL
ncbi:hypothetical protein [Prauserella muralis]|uniref:Uncharacterized protein n=1 Tax=Prauserella muralis TaxID=588067 RepID=A0A2V4AGL9_9PSEU|nr:hypothetical protein [Prauserella muralis]PXY18999.1 hypothetical protein BAY60_29720 [Prauserella muralis]TWE28891.1 hypothetical protein FHX69_1559 [Prauserella muralis]